MVSIFIKLVIFLIILILLLYPQYHVLAKSSDSFLDLKNNGDIKVKRNNSINSYIINLDRSKERYEYSKPNIEGLGYPVTRISAVDGKLLTEEQYNRFVDSKFYKKVLGVLPDKGTVGCSLSHINAWKEFLNSDAEYAMIFEDDVKFDSYKLKSIVQQLVENKELWDIVNFESWHHGFPLKVKKLDDNVYMVVYLGNITHAGSYLINRNAARRLLAKSLPIKIPIDWYFNRTWELDLKFIGIEPRIVKQSFPGSEIDKTRKQSISAAKKSFYMRAYKLFYRIQTDIIRFLYNLKQYIVSIISL